MPILPFTLAWVMILTTGPNATAPMVVDRFASEAQCKATADQARRAFERARGEPGYTIECRKIASPGQ